ncbi:bifunctional riboflavin kinase/FAD synthetase [Staphylococcus gallinarum]|jgi:riboflavin kinase/FMN adenylyltransferase|uniref:Riboflavin biosynthesis protein n=1 Tax=Staphylococcus gallinarum TaxID=1293 RepID=A0A2T4SZ57_STAGA|nr:bifunctional riboflavin kinase/FAD synthetase [Staphylococcus gallinarum]MCD8820346.1 bifunctional riboflavin kinase/FAD synthetase [Staphylococcus gallinarum]MCD8870520.1 bifunctional riboflavin kinase/FAD synthetase [Staphylococcus gallinarum]MCW0984815.1 bifunctional riboflavin kinase/FAD synthetase [Staphylococcus gallinarum]MEB6242027.1 bifunctional riboflavin kinase/FAD synthetase [Staphylococcus gallinarum]MEB6295204.1 bifunctional riboflavin kinase/FAD synthetase [Staphylococcus gal
MKVIEVAHPIQEKQYIQEDVAMAFGFFDGMHKGHAKVFDTLSQIAEEKNLKKAVMTFDPHPSVVLNPELKRTDYLTPIQDKVEILETFGIDYCIVINFSSKFADVTAESFIEDYIIKNHVKEVVAGFDFTFGKFGKGNMLILDEMSEFNTTTVSKQEIESEKISTTAIRKALKSGDLQKANEELGYRFRIKGTVVQGEKRGRTIGFPTANVQPSDDYVLPKNGVYAVSMEIGSDHKVYRGVANVGVKPTFHDPSVAQVVIEVNIFDFDDDIYGERVTVFWHHFLRPEIKFDGIDPLVEQMNKDKEKAKYLLAVDFGDDISYNI